MAIIGRFGWFSAVLVGTFLTATASAEDFTTMSLEDLMSVKVTGVTKRAQPLGRSPAAVYVLSADDIRRSGARSIAEALRLVPGLDVAQVNAETWAISARGFNNIAEDKLEVELDGRSVYTPLFSGVYWDVLDTYLPDIERIEVIRGPGGSVWGANAVNGVINIVTKAAKDSQGTQIMASGGTLDRNAVAARTGGRFADTGYVRAYAKTTEIGETDFGNGARGPDGSMQRQGGLRMDYSTPSGDQLSLSGDGYSGDIYDTNGKTAVHGGNVEMRWDRAWATAGESNAELTFDTYKRVVPLELVETRRTYEFDAQHSLQPIAHNTLTAGVTVKTSHDETGGPPLSFVFSPSSKSLNIYGLFLQDEYDFAQGRGSLLGGTKIEHTTYGGTDWAPTIRAGWTFNDRLFGWASVSRAVRTPNRVDHDVALFCSAIISTLTGCTVGSIFPLGNPNFESERVIAYEAGARWQANPKLLVEVASFYNHYSKLTSVEDTQSLFTAHEANLFHAEGSGGEINVSWTVADHLVATAYYSYLALVLERQPGSNDIASAYRTDHTSPRNQAFLRLSWQPDSPWSLDGRLRYVDRLASLGVPSYIQLDTRAAYRIGSELELALIGQNLLRRRHVEFTSGGSTPPSYITRSAVAELRWYWH